MENINSIAKKVHEFTEKSKLKKLIRKFQNFIGINPKSSVNPKSNEKDEKIPAVIELNKQNGCNNPQSYMKYLHSQEVWEDIDVKVILKNYSNASKNDFDNYSK